MSTGVSTGGKNEKVWVLLTLVDSDIETHAYAGGCDSRDSDVQASPANVQDQTTDKGGRMSKDALIGYIAGRLTEVLAETRVDQDTGCSGLSVYVRKLRGTCEALLRLCLSHTDGYNAFVGEHDKDTKETENGRSEQEL